MPHAQQRAACAPEAVRGDVEHAHDARALPQSPHATVRQRQHPQQVRAAHERLAAALLPQLRGVAQRAAVALEAAFAGA